MHQIIIKCKELLILILHTKISIYDILIRFFEKITKKTRCFSVAGFTIEILKLYCRESFSVQNKVPIAHLKPNIIGYSSLLKNTIPIIF